MMNKKILIALGVIVVVAVGFYAYNKKEAKAPVPENGSGQAAFPSEQPATTSAPAEPQTAPASTSPQTSAPSKGHFSSGEGDANAPDIQVVAIDYDGSAYTPSSVNIKVGDWVFFRNKSTVDFWPASNPHPTHTDYPGFDALQPIAPGGEYKFQFQKAGSWGFHDHLNPLVRGVVNVNAQ